MQNTSQTWKDMWASGTAILEARSVIAGTAYTDMPTAPVVNRALMQNGLSIGNAVSATCQLSVRTTDTIPKSAEVVIQYRLTDGATASEWLTAGTFYISHRQRDPVTGVVALVCYDALLKANMAMPKLMPWTTKGGQVMTTRSGEWLYLSAHYPRSMAAVLNDLLLVLGLELDPATQIAEGDGYTINDVTPGTTINNVLGKIAAANGGNWIMTPAGKLKLVPVVSAAGAAGATANVVDVDGIVGGIGVSNTGTITGIRYSTEDGPQVAGDESGLVVDADVNPSVATALLSQIGGMTYQAYELRGAVYDPAAELGDYVRAGADGEVRAVLCAEVATLGPGFTGDISAPEIGEMADEYPYVGTSATILGEAMAYAETAATEAANALDRTLTQQEVFDRLTDGGLTQGLSLEPVTQNAMGASTPKRVFLNVDFVNNGTMPFNHLKGDKLTLGGENNVNGYMEILDADGNPVFTGNMNGAAIYGGTFQNDTSDGKYRMTLSAGELSFYKKVANAFTQIFSLMGTDEQAEGVRMNAVGEPLIVDVQDATDGLYVRCYSGDSDMSGHSSILHITPEQVSLAIRNNGVSVGGIDITFLAGGTPNIYVQGNFNVDGDIAALNAASGYFTTADGKTVIVTNGIITAIT